MHTHKHSAHTRGSNTQPSKYPRVRAAEVFKQPYLKLYLSWRCAAERRVKGDRRAAAGRSIRDMKHMPDLSCSIYSLLSARTEDVRNLVDDSSSRRLNRFEFWISFFFFLQKQSGNKTLHSNLAWLVRINHDENIFLMSSAPPLPPHPTSPAFTLFRQLLQQETGQCWLSLRLRKILRPFISSRGAQIVFKTINTIPRSETGGPIYPVAVLNAEDKTNDNTVCLLWPSPQALIAGLVPTELGGNTWGVCVIMRSCLGFYCCPVKWFALCYY